MKYNNEDLTRGEAVLVVLAVLCGIIAILFLGGLIWWGLGSLFCKVFALSYIWTYWHGFVVNLLLTCLTPIKVLIRKE